MTALGIDGFNAERAAILDIASSLSDDEWNAPSGCEGWAVRDVIAHMAAVLHGVADPSTMPDMASGTEKAMEGPVADRRVLPVDEVVGEYATFSEQIAASLPMFQEPPLSTTELPMHDLGTHPMSIVPDMFVFDAYCHLRHDILRPRGSIDRPEPPRDEQRLRPAITWMLAGLPWMSASTLAFLDRPIVLTLEGPGGGTWTIHPRGDAERVQVVDGDDATAAARVTSNDHAFVAWATRRAPWHEHVTVTGDEAYATRVLDAVHIF
jgi:uncharacterized protein (TIGR03083 family)